MEGAEAAFARCGNRTGSTYAPLTLQSAVSSSPTFGVPASPSSRLLAVSTSASFSSFRTPFPDFEQVSAPAADEPASQTVGKPTSCRAPVVLSVGTAVGALYFELPDASVVDATTRRRQRTFVVERCQRTPSPMARLAGWMGSLCILQKRCAPLLLP